MQTAAAASIDVATLSRTLLAIHENASELPVVDFKSWLVALLKSLIRFDSALVGFGQVEEGTATIPTFFLYNISEAVMRERDTIADIDIVGQQAAASMGRSVMVRVADWEKQRATHGRMLDYASRYGFMNVLVTAVPPSVGNLQAFISLFRAGRDDRFSEADRQTKELLMPHIVRALQVNRSANLQRFSTLERESERVQAIVDRSGRVYESSEGFDALLRRDLAGYDGKSLPAELVAHLGAGRRARATLQRSIYDIVPTNGMFFISARSRAAIDDLSGREREVAESFAAGLTNKEIAKNLGLSPATVRRHVQNVYAKLGIDTKAALVRALG